MVVTINGNCRNTPVEVFETRYPSFLIEEYRLLPDSGGPGEWRGGLGGERMLTVTDEVTVSALLNRMKADPWGVLGGGNGDRGGLWVKLAGHEAWQTFVEAFGTKSPSKFSGIRSTRVTRSSSSCLAVADMAIRYSGIERLSSGTSPRDSSPWSVQSPPTVTVVSEQGGHWVEPDVNYVDPERRFCAFCGRPIARRYWEVEAAGVGKVAYCSPDHADRKATYPVQLNTSEHA